MFLQLYIINRSGGLIYNRNLSTAAPNISVNETLRLGSTFHGLHAIATQIAPIISLGIEKLETDTFKLQCFQSLTGVKFFVTALPGTPDVDNFLQETYVLYADYVLKVSCLARLPDRRYFTLQNPFYEMEMPIRCELFNRHMEKLIAKFTPSKSRKS
jgi:hypothetical protein